LFVLSLAKPFPGHAVCRLCWGVEQNECSYDDAEGITISGRLVLDFLKPRTNEIKQD
jgi:hypothetical protein